MSKFVPTNLEDILDYLDKSVSKEDKAEFLKSKLGSFHNSIGRAMRNDWGLWDQNSEISQWFLSIGIWHADDMSGIILDSFRRRLIGLDIELNYQVENYKFYWKNSKGPESKVVIKFDKKTGEYQVIR